MLFCFVFKQFFKAQSSLETFETNKFLIVIDNDSKIKKSDSALPGIIFFELCGAAELAGVRLNKKLTSAINFLAQITLLYKLTA